jgi:glycosyltransferase involved in cell wall biosynthesis
MKISVVVPTYRRPHMLERCLHALLEQDFDPYEFEIVIADDAPEKAVMLLVERCNSERRGAPFVRYVPVTATQGPAGARNRGWQLARGDVIAFTDDDTIPHRNWLREGWNAMTAGAVAASGRVVVPLASATPTDYERDIARMQEAEFVTANCFVRRDALEAIGGFDERFTAAWREDSDLQFSLMRHGSVVRAEKAIVDHPVRPVSGWMYGIRQHRKILFDALLFKKHPRLYRERIRRTPPWNYYAIVGGFAVMLAGAMKGAVAVSLVGMAFWLGLTASFAVKRLRGTSRDPAHVREMIVTSILIPFVAIYWRLAGAWRFRVLFL